MRLNHKLTPLISGRIIQAVTQNEQTGQITFRDGSVMTIKLGRPIPVDFNRTTQIKLVRQGETQMGWEFVDGTSFEISLAETTSRVLLRDAQGHLEYTD